jgi:DNA polymerase III subunit epsilon
MTSFDLNSWRTTRQQSPAIADSEFAVLDVETTGLVPEKTDRIVEVGIIHLNGALEVIDQWSSLVNPDRDVGPTHIHGITGAMAKDAPPFSEVADDLVHRLAGRVLVAHNASFDLRFLRAEFQRLNLSIPTLATIDTYRLSGQSLENACRTYDIVHRDAHSALGDVHATAELLRRLLNTRHTDARTIAHLGSDQPPAPLTDWPPLFYEPTEHHRSPGPPAVTPNHNLDLEPGAWICFTGEAQIMFDGQLITRTLATELAIHAELVVKSGVSKKLSVLVAADTESLSGKAKKARDYQIPIVTHQQFWSSVGIETAPVSNQWKNWSPRPGYGRR